MNKKAIIGIAAALIVAIGAGVAIFVLTGNKEEAPAPKKKEPVKEPEPIVNPLTGSEQFNPKALNRRVAAFVVENHPDARPQIGMDGKNSPDIILEGEVEGGISRMLWFFADYRKLPKVIGPTRSARPPFIRFSKVWDAIFIHWGMSHTEGGYVGANTVFEQERVSHINAMSFSNKCGAFGRDMSTGKSLEHTGRAYGKKIPAAIKEAGVRRKPKKYTQLKFKKEKEAGPMSEKTCRKLTARFSRVSGTTSWTYNKKTEKYTSDSFQNNVARDNLIVLFDRTEYVTNAVYQGHGVTYCNYALGGGKGFIASKGTILKIRWRIKNGKLQLFTREKKLIEEPEEEKTDDKDSAKDEMEEESKPKYEIIRKPVYLNPGKSWIGWVSSNNGGSINVKRMPKENDDNEGEDA